MPDIARVFAYHGAEHKTINAFEAGAEMTPEVVSQYSVEHPRCGTAFLLTLIVLSIFVFALLGPLGGIWRYVSRLILIIPLASLAYEFIRWSSNHRTNPLVNLIVKPNLGFTTSDNYVNQPLKCWRFQLLRSNPCWNRKQEVQELPVKLAHETPELKPGNRLHWALLIGGVSSGSGNVNLTA